MRAIQIKDHSGPRTALELVDLPVPGPAHPLTPGRGVLIDVEAAGVSFPELLQTRGQYQLSPPLPFVPGCDVAGTVREAPAGSAFGPGDRVAAFCVLGGFADVVAAPEHLTFRLPPSLTVQQGAALVMNYHTAHFALVTRGRLQAGEKVLVHGAAGGVGTAAIQVAKGLGATTFAAVSTHEKGAVAASAGADEVVLTGDGWKDEVLERSGGRGVDLVIDTVGGELFTDSLRALAECGRLVVVGFAAGSIPQVKVNRLLLSNLEVIGAGWGAYSLDKPDHNQRTGAQIDRLIASGDICPLVGATFPLEQAADALELLDRRGATGKVVLDLTA